MGDVGTRTRLESTLVQDLEASEEPPASTKVVSSAAGKSAEESASEKDGDDVISQEEDAAAAEVFGWGQEEVEVDPECPSEIHQAAIHICMMPSAP